MHAGDDMSRPTVSSPPPEGRPATGDAIANPDEVTEVRDGEHLDWDTLEAYLREHLEVDGTFQALQFPNGSANLTYRLQFGEQFLVLRRPPFGTVARGAHDMRREFRALSRLWKQYPRAPRAFHLCTDPDIVGSDFLVEEYRPGVVVWRTIPPQLDTAPDAGQRLGRAVVKALAELHRVDVTRDGLDELGRPEGYLQRQLDGWTARWTAVAPAVDHDVSRLGDELRRTVPSSPRPTIVHNDFKVDNCQFAPGDPDTVISVFDWDMATVGDPLVDLGTMLNYWPDPSAPEAPTAVPGLEELGLPSPAEVVDLYARVSDIDVAEIDWYVAFGCWKTAVILQQLNARWLRGETSDARMASRGDAVEALAQRGRELLTTG